MDKVTSLTPDQRLRRAQARVTAADAAHKSARRSGGVVPFAVTKEAGEARKDLQREQVGPERYDEAGKVARETILSRAQRLVATGPEDKSGHGPMAVLPFAQFAEAERTGVLPTGWHHEPGPDMSRFRTS